MQYRHFPMDVFVNNNIFFGKLIKVTGATTIKIIVNNVSTSTQLIQKSILCLYMRCGSLDCSYIVFKWIKMCFTVPSLWLISNKKTGRVKVIPINPQNINREQKKSGY